MEPMRVWPRK